MTKGNCMTPEQKARISAGMMGNTNFLGHHCSEASKTKISVAGRAWRAIPENREKMSVAQKKRFLRLGEREKTSAGIMGNTNALGSHHSKETKIKISAALIGRKATPEARAKMSVAHKMLVGPLNNVWKGGPRVWVAKSHSKRRTLGFLPLNSWFPGCEGHHINKSDVIYLPRKLHRSISHNQWTGKGMVAINALAGQFLTEDWT